MNTDTGETITHSRPRLRTKRAETEAELAAHFAIRREVFVKEQSLFRESDVDARDRNAIAIICTVNDAIGGTVRVYPLEGSTWVGGRLAVLKPYRTYLVGPLLVKKAVKTVKEQGCTKFIAYIQSQNVRFFQRLRWTVTGETVVINGLAHYVMEADLV